MYSSNELNFWLFTVHLPLFIFLQGLFYNTKSKMCSAAGEFHHFDSLQLHLLNANIPEWTKTVAEEYRHDVNVQFIGETRLQTLSRCACGANDVHMC